MSESSTKTRILFVDDEARITQMVAAALVARGFEVLALTEPQGALAAFLAHPADFDVAVLDHAMPELSGLELAERIFEHRQDLPILLLSGFAEGISRAALARAGVRECLAKPFPLSQLASVVHALVTQAS